jgi:hypothetical protein
VHQANVRRSLTCVALVSLLVLPAGARAQVDFFWNGQGQPAGTTTLPPATGGGGTWDATAINWVTPTANGAASAWVNGNNANFFGTAGTVTVSGSFTAAAVNFGTTGYVVTNAATGNTVTTSTITAASGIVGKFGTNGGNSVLTGTGGLAISGGGEVIVATAIKTDGGITVSGGSTLTIGDRTQTSGVAPSSFLTGTSNTNGLTLTGSNLTVATTLSLASAPVRLQSLAVSGASTITIFRANSGSASVAVPFTTDGAAAGTTNVTPLSIAAGSSLAIALGGNTNGATPRVTLGATTYTGAGGTVTFQTAASGGNTGSAATFASNLTLGAVTDNGNTTVFQGQGSATQLPGGGIFLNTASTFTGPWTIGNAAGTQGVVVSLGNATNAASALTTGDVTVNPFGSLQFFSATSASFGGATQTITLNGVGAQTSGGVGTPGALKYGIAAGSSTTFAGNVVIGTVSPITVINVVTLNTLTLGGSFTANGAMQFVGGGTLALSQAGAGSGGVTVGAGTLRAVNTVGSATGTGTVTVSGGTLSSGTSASPSIGTYGGSVIIAAGGVISPGFGVGTLTHNNGTMTWQGGGTYNFEFNATTLSPTPGTTNDFVNSGGTLDLNSASAANKFIINPIAVGFAPDGSQAVSYTLAQFSGNGVNSVSGFDPAKFTVNPSFAMNASVALVTNANSVSVVLNFTPVPEPATVLLLCAAGAGVAGYVRRRRLTAV